MRPGRTMARSMSLFALASLWLQPVASYFAVSGLVPKDKSLWSTDHANALSTTCGALAGAGVSSLAGAGISLAVLQQSAESQGLIMDALLASAALSRVGVAPLSPGLAQLIASITGSVTQIGEVVLLLSLFHAMNSYAAGRAAAPRASAKQHVSAAAEEWKALLPFEEASAGGDASGAGADLSSLPLFACDAATVCVQEWSSGELRWVCS